MVEVLAAHAGLALLAERYDEADAVARQCLEAGEELHGPEVHRAVSDARVTLASLRDSSDPATLDEIARDPELAGTSTATRALNNALLAHLEQLDERAHTTSGQVSAWIRVSEARTLSRSWPDQGTILRQAVDLAFRTGQWERGWSYAHEQLAEPSIERNERVSVLAKTALLAWQRQMLSEAREFGEQARLSSVAVDHPWVRTYAYLGGVISAAAGAGPIDRALTAYENCVTSSGHASRPHRAWAAAQIAIDAGHPVEALRKFLDHTLPGVLGDEPAEAPADLRALIRVLLADAEETEKPPDTLREINIAALDAPVAARVLLAEARWLRRTARPTASAAALAHASTLLRDWPGLLSEQLAKEYELTIPSLVSTPAQTRVLELLAEGWTNARIGEHLGLSERTVAVHVGSLLRQHSAAGRTELAARYLRYRLQPQVTSRATQH